MTEPRRIPRPKPEDIGSPEKSPNYLLLEKRLAKRYGD